MPEENKYNKMDADSLKREAIYKAINILQMPAMIFQIMGSIEKDSELILLGKKLEEAEEIAKGILKKMEGSFDKEIK